MNKQQESAFATKFYFGNLDLITPQTRALFLHQCANYLMAQCALSRERADTVAVQTLGEIESTKCAFAIDTDRSTSFALVVTNRKTNTRHAFTIAEVLERLGEF